MCFTFAHKKWYLIFSVQETAFTPPTIFPSRKPAKHQVFSPTKPAGAPRSD
jgi:hypothetical protein